MQGPLDKWKCKPDDVDKWHARERNYITGNVLALLFEKIRNLLQIKE